MDFRSTKRLKFTINLPVSIDYMNLTSITSLVKFHYYFKIHETIFKILKRNDTYKTSDPII